MDWEPESPGALKSFPSIPVIENSAMDGREPVVHELLLPEEVEMNTAKPNPAEDTGSGKGLAEKVGSFAVSLSSAAKPKSILRRQATATSGITRQVSWKDSRSGELTHVKKVPFWIRDLPEDQRYAGPSQSRHVDPEDEGGIASNDLVERLDLAAQHKDILKLQHKLACVKRELETSESLDLRERYLWDVDDMETQLAVLEGYAMASAAVKPSW